MQIFKNQGIKMPFENQLELTIRAFFFNAKTDYLPYYKNFTFSVNKEMNLKEILAMIQEENPDFSYPDKDLIFRVNNLMVTGDEQVSTIVEKLGTQLQIDPALTYRSDNGLILNNHDFMHQFRRVLGHYTTKEDLAYYLTLYPVHYASETFNYNHEYIGDAILILASKLIKDGSEHKEAILTAINDEFEGIVCCEYENNLFDGEDYTQTIQELKEEINNIYKPTIMDKIKSKCLDKMKTENSVESLKGQNIALYMGNNNASELLNAIQTDANKIGTFINFDMSTKLAGQTLLDSNPTMAYQKAGTMLLDALDSGADVLIFSKDEDLKFCQTIISQAENSVGRDIELGLISLSTFKEMVKHSK